MFLLDPNPYSHVSGSGSGSRSMELTNKPVFQSFAMFYDVSITYMKHIFHLKIHLFCDIKFWPGSGSAWIRVRLAPQTRIRIETNADSATLYKLYLQYKFSFLLFIAFERTSGCDRISVGGHIRPISKETLSKASVRKIAALKFFLSMRVSLLCNPFPRKGEGFRIRF